MERTFNLILSRIDAAARILLLGCMTVMIAVVALQVLMRYAFNGSLDWADEVSRLAFVWSVFIAIPLGIREGAHVGIELLVNKMPRQIGRQVTRVMLALSFVLMCVVTYQSVIVAYKTWSERMGAIDISSSYFFVAVVVGSAHAALHLLHLVLHPLDKHAPEYPID